MEGSSLFFPKGQDPGNEGTWWMFPKGESEAHQNTSGASGVEKGEGKKSDSGASREGMFGRLKKFGRRDGREGSVSLPSSETLSFESGDGGWTEETREVGYVAKLDELERLDLVEQEVKSTQNPFAWMGELAFRLVVEVCASRTLQRSAIGSSFGIPVLDLPSEAWCTTSLGGYVHVLPLIVYRTLEFVWRNGKCLHYFLR